MVLRKILAITILAASCLAASAAVPQSDKQPIIANTGRFGDATGTALKYQGYLFGVIQKIDPSQLTLSKTKVGVDQPFRLNKKTKFLRDGKASSLDKLKVGDGVY